MQYTLIHLEYVESDLTAKLNQYNIVLIFLMVNTAIELVLVLVQLIL